MTSADLGPAALAIAALAVPLVYVPALDSAFVEPKLALLLAAGALGLGGQALALAAGTRRVRWRPSVTAALIAVLLSSALAAAAAALRGPPGAPYAVAELLRLLAVAGVAAAAAQAAADARWRGLLLEAMVAGAGMVALLGLVQHLQLARLPIPVISLPGSTFGNRNLAAEAVALALPFGLALSARGDGRRPALAPAIFLGLQVVYLAVARARGAWLGGALGVVTFLAVARPRATRAAYLLAGALAVAAALAAVVPGRWSPQHALDTKRYQPGGRLLVEAADPHSAVARTRFGLWRRTLALYRAHPVLGVGPGNFAVYFPLYAEPGATADGVLSPTVVPRRAHQDLLERLAETGPLGLGALLTLYAAAARAALARRRRGPGGDVGLAGAGAGALAALLGCGLTGFPLAMPATALLFGVAIGVLAPRDDDGPEPVSPPRRRWPLRAGAVAFTAVAFVATGVVSARRLGGSYWLARGESALHKRAAGEALAHLARAENADRSSFMAALRSAHAALLAGAPAAAQEAAARALRLEPYSPNAWAALAEADLRTGDAPAAAHAARAALTLLADYPAAQETQAAAVKAEEEGRQDAKDAKSGSDVEGSGVSDPLSRLRQRVRERAAAQSATPSPLPDPVPQAGEGGR